MKLVITEKPSVASAIAKRLGASNRQDGYFSGPDYIITWCYGHLLELASPEVYNASWKKWKEEDLPIIPQKFQWQAIMDKGSQKQLDVIGKLFKKSFSTVVNACDAGREGELIFRTVYLHWSCKLPIERAWLVSLTDQAIDQAFNALRDGRDYDNLASAAEARAEADWLVGFNATRAMTLASQKTGGSGVLSIGRVQTPVLAMIVERDRARESFTVSYSYEPRLTLISHGEEFTAKYSGEGLLDEKAAQAICDKIQSASVKNVVATEKKIAPPKLHDLTLLQREANEAFGFTAQQTLDLAQSLYEKKLITYPRTDSNYLTSDSKSAIAKLTSIHAPDCSEGLRSACFNSAKVSDHHAIIPTEQQPKSLSQEEEQLYKMVLNRFIANHLPDEIQLETTVTIEAGEYSFIAKAMQVTRPGWNAVEQKNRQEVSLPPLEIGETLEIKEKEVHKKKSSPPPAFTEATLLKAMENVGNQLDEEEFDEERKILKAVAGIGTPATRAGIIELLLTRGYICRDAKKIEATTLGKELIQTFPVDGLKSPILTAKWEMALESIKEGKTPKNNFMMALKAHVKTSVDEIHNAKISIPSTQTQEKRVGECPFCHSPIQLYDKYFRCTNRPECQFSCSRVVAQKSLTENDVSDLLTKGVTRLISGFVSKKGAKFKAKLALKEGKIEFDFSGNDKHSKKGSKK